MSHHISAWSSSHLFYSNAKTNGFRGVFEQFLSGSSEFNYFNDSALAIFIMALDFWFYVYYFRHLIFVERQWPNFLINTTQTSQRRKHNGFKHRKSRNKKIMDFTTKCEINQQQHDQKHLQNTGRNIDWAFGYIGEQQHFSAGTCIR